MLRIFLSRTVKRAVVCDFAAQTILRSTMATLPPDRPKKNPKRGKFNSENVSESERAEKIARRNLRRSLVLPKDFSLAEGIPGGFSESMMVLTDLIVYSEPLMRIPLNRALENKRLQRVEFVSDSIFRLRDKYVFAKEKAEILECLNTVFFGDKILRIQWETCWRWKMKRTPELYPPVWRWRTELRALKSGILVQEEYSEFREVAVMMVDLLIADELFDL